MADEKSAFRVQKAFSAAVLPTMVTTSMNVRILILMSTLCEFIMNSPITLAFHVSRMPHHTIVDNHHMLTHLRAKPDLTTSELVSSSSKLGEQHPPIMNIPQIMALLQDTYPESNTKQQWTKTRNYLYQYRANSRSNKQLPNNSTSAEDELAPIKTKRVRSKNLSIENVQQIISFLQSTFPDHPQLQAHILQNSPRILSQYHSIESRLIPTIEFLRGLYGDMADSNGTKGGMIYEAIWRNTNLLLVRGVGYAGGGWEDSNGDNSVEEYLIELGVSSTGVAKLKKSHPTLFQISLEQTVKPVVQFLNNVLGGASVKQKKQISKIITSYPMLLHLDVESNLAPKVGLLQSFCDLDDGDLALIIGTTPGILGLSFESNLRPTLQLLLDVLTLESKRFNINGTVDHESNKETPVALLRKCILKHPHILGLSLSNIQTKVTYFDKIDLLGTSNNLTTKHIRKGGTLASRILLSAPSTYSLSLKNIAEKVNYLAAIWGCKAPNIPLLGDDLNRTDTAPSFQRLSDNLRTYPPILTLSMEGNIKPTMAFYNMSGYIQLDQDGLPYDNAPGITKHSKIQGRYIATSLYNRLLPRWHYLTLNPVENQTIAGTTIYPTVEQPAPNENETAPDTLPPLHLLAGASDEVFCRQMDLSLSHYLLFKKAKAPQLKFNSQFEIWLQTGRPIVIDQAPR